MFESTYIHEIVIAREYATDAILIGLKGTRLLHCVRNDMVKLVSYI